ncbi:hypothetical protein QN416_26010, partial [Glaciimonas sp. Cout2]|uniref:hypothetical protein n=1 Tax=Glaciimonas sp. Cout2 TaxID=3048621 RepID=UPI002B228302
IHHQDRGGAPFAPPLSWWWILTGFLVFVTPPGKMALSVLASRLHPAEEEPGAYPRAGSVHLRLWLAEQVSLLVDAVSLAGAPWI